MKKLYKMKYEKLDNIIFFRKILKRLISVNANKKEVDNMKNVIMRLKNEYKNIKLKMNALEA